MRVYICACVRVRALTCVHVCMRESSPPGQREHHHSERRQQAGYLRKGTEGGQSHKTGTYSRKWRAGSLTLLRSRRAHPHAPCTLPHGHAHGNYRERERGGVPSMDLCEFVPVDLDVIRPAIECDSVPMCVLCSRAYRDNFRYQGREQRKERAKACLRECMHARA